MSKGRKTYENQLKLKKLPIPDLDSTLNKYLVTVKPLQTSVQEHEKTVKAVEQFAEGDGKTCQELLLEYAKDKDNYVESFWSDAYLVPDASPVLNLNPFFLLEEGPDNKNSSDQAGRAASLVYASLKFASLLYHEALHPDVVKGTPLCMDQFKHIFGSCRIPILGGKDYVISDPGSKHVVVLCHGQIYYFKALNEDGSVGIDEEGVKQVIHAILQDSEKLDARSSTEGALGVCTTLDRSKWALTRQNLLAHSNHNKNTLSIIDSGLFVLVLDDFIPRNIHEAAANVLHGSYCLQGDEKEGDFQVGTAINRWYDKLQLIVMKDGSAGVNFEHSAVDGHTALRYVSDIFADTVVSFAQSITKTIYSKDHVPSILEAEVDTKQGLDSKPKRLEFELPTSVIAQIHFAETTLGDQLLQSHTHVLEFADFGKMFITGNKMSPDSFVQMSIILAYYRLYGEFVCAYEPVLMKRFLHGRTEAMRSATPKGKLFVECWCSDYSTKDDKIERLREAVTEHSKLVKEAASGGGVDRHLFALKCIAAENNMATPDFFNDDAWKKLNHTVLSTSNCGNPSLRLFGFGPVVPDGYGIGYIIRDNGLQFSISSKHRQTERFANTLVGYLREVKAFLGGAEKIAVRKHRGTAVGASIPMDIDVGSPRNKTKVAVDMTQYAEGYDDIYGESTTHEGLMGGVKRRPTLSVETLDKVGIDLMHVTNNHVDQKRKIEGDGS